MRTGWPWLRPQRAGAASVPASGVRRAVGVAAFLVCGVVPAAPVTVDAGDPLPRTTSPQIAARNLDYGIAVAQRRLDAAPSDAAVLRGWLDVLFTRVDMFATYDDFDAALQRSRRALALAPDDVGVLVQRARVLQRLHRFDEALTLLADASDGLAGLEPTAAGRARAEIAAQLRAIDLARGRADAVIASVDASPESFAGRVQRAAALKARGEREAATDAYASALDFWDGISPFAIAWIEFSIGEVWVGHDDALARHHYERAVTVLPDFVKARVHLSELVAEQDGPEAAVEMLEPLRDVQDPEPLARTVEYLAADGPFEPALQAQARSRWRALLERHPLAFADHGAEFYLAAGDDAALALEWASRNLENRSTSRAWSLFIDASLAAGETPCGKRQGEGTREAAIPADVGERLRVLCSGAPGG